MNSPFKTKQHICKCGCKKFRIIAELHFDAQGAFNPKDGWQFECIKCSTIYDKNGLEIVERTPLEEQIWLNEIDDKGFYKNK
jgi:hypothetical protein